MAEPLVLSLAEHGSYLRRLEPGDAPVLHELIRVNRDHLTAHGDYLEQVTADVRTLAQELEQGRERHWRFGVFFHGALSGRLDVIGVDPPRYSIGYWLAQSATGRGLATAAVMKLLDFAHRRLGATDIYAGVTHGNTRSVEVLNRAGFDCAERFETYARFHRALP